MVEVRSSTAFRKKTWKGEEDDKSWQKSFPRWCSDALQVLEDDDACDGELFQLYHRIIVSCLLRLAHFHPKKEETSDSEFSRFFSVKNREKREEERRWKKNLLSKHLRMARVRCVYEFQCALVQKKKRERSGKENRIMINSSHRLLHGHEKKVKDLHMMQSVNHSDSSMSCPFSRWPRQCSAPSISRGAHFMRFRRNCQLKKLKNYIEI